MGREAVTNEARRVFCKDCRHYTRWFPWQTRTADGELADETCAKAAEIEYHPINGPLLRPHRCDVRNANMDCALYELRVERPTPVEPEPKRPWWRFWR